MRHYVFSDESRQDAHKFVLIGGINVPSHAYVEIHDRITSWQKYSGFLSEIKWTKINIENFRHYKSLVDLFFELRDQRLLEFHCAIGEAGKLKQIPKDPCDRDANFHRMYFWYWVSLMGRITVERNPNAKFTLHPHKRLWKRNAKEILRILNRGIRRRSNLTFDPFTNFQELKSEDSIVLQLNDLLLGAVGYHKHGLHKVPKPKKVKVDLSAHIAARVGVSELGFDSPYGETGFKQWNVILNKGRGWTAPKA